ncbi:RHS repeat-associated core domain-containing protein [Pseudomonas sp. RT6P73]
MTNPALHRNTPTLQVSDPSGSPVRSVAYYRRCSSEQPQPRVTATATRRAGRVSQHWDPRLFALSAIPSADTANLCGVTSLSGRPLLTESVDAGWQLHLWGASGELQMAWDGRGTRTRHTNDALLRPVAVFEQRLDAPEHCIGLTTYGDQTPEARAHNQCGQPVRVDDTAGCRQLHGYSLQGAPLAETRRFLRELTSPDWPPAVEDREALLERQQATTHWRHDVLGALRQQTDAQGNRQSTDYNVAGQIVSSRLLLKGQTEATTVLRDLGYNAWGQLTTETAGNGVTSTATYRPDTGVLQRLMAQRADHRCVQDLHYAYDPIGNVLSISDASQSIRYFANARIDPVTTYTYDSLSQLIEATGREVASSGHGPEVRVSADPSQLVNYTQRYAYDAAGNLHTLQHQGARRYTRQMQVAERSNRSLQQKTGGPLRDAQELSAGFDANGNVQQLQPGQALYWDGRNQLCQVTPVVRESGAVDSEHYVYDGAGQRLRKVRVSQAKALRHIAQVHYLPGLEIREDSASGETLHVISLQSPGRSSVRVLHWVAGTPPGVRNNQLRYGVGDHLGSSTLELDREARLVSQEGYYPYGGTAWWAASQQSEVKYKTVRYSGKERDATGLYYYGFRYYAPGWGRWLNPDPAGTVDGLNLFAFVSNNPITLRDTNGLQKFDFNFIIHVGDDFESKTYAQRLFTKYNANGKAILIHWDPRSTLESTADNPYPSLQYADGEKNFPKIGERTRLFFVMHGSVGPKDPTFEIMPELLKFNWVDYKGNDQIAGFHGGPEHIKIPINKEGGKVQSFVGAIKKARLFEALKFSEGDKNLGRISLVSCNLIAPNIDGVDTPYSGFAENLFNELNKDARTEVTARFGKVTVERSPNGISKYVLQPWIESPTPVRVKSLGAKGKHVFTPDEKMDWE